MNVVSPGSESTSSSPGHPAGELRRDRQPEPGPLRVVGRVERLEDPRQRPLVDPLAVVAHEHSDVSVGASRGDDDLGSVRRVGDRVVDQDPHDLGQPDRVALGVDRLAAAGQAQLQPGVVLGQGRLELAGDRPRQLAEIDLLGPELERSGLQAREVEQVDRQLAEACDLVADLVEEAAARLGIELLVLEQLDEPAQREQRRAQLVGRGRDELLARQIELRAAGAACR